MANAWRVLSKQPNGSRVATFIIHPFYRAMAHVPGLAPFPGAGGRGTPHDRSYSSRSSWDGWDGRGTALGRVKIKIHRQNGPWDGWVSRDPYPHSEFCIPTSFASISALCVRPKLQDDLSPRPVRNLSRRVKTCQKVSKRVAPRSRPSLHGQLPSSRTEYPVSGNQHPGHVLTLS